MEESAFGVEHVSKANWEARMLNVNPNFSQARSYVGAKAANVRLGHAAAKGKISLKDAKGAGKYNKGTMQIVRGERLPGRSRENR